jgi:hypothetical protein
MSKISDMLFMKSAESLSTLYRIISTAVNETAAINAVNAAVGNVMYEIQEAGEVINAENIDRRLEEYVRDYIEVAEKTNVA